MSKWSIFIFIVFFPLPETRSAHFPSSQVILVMLKGTSMSASSLPPFHCSTLTHFGGQNPPLEKCPPGLPPLFFQAPLLCSFFFYLFNFFVDGVMLLWAFTSLRSRLLILFWPATSHSLKVEEVDGNMKPLCSEQQCDALFLRSRFPTWSKKQNIPLYRPVQFLHKATGLRMVASSFDAQPFTQLITALINRK